MNTGKDEGRAMSEHVLNEYGTTDCPVEGVRAFADDGECSACGAPVVARPAPQTDPEEKS